MVVGALMFGEVLAIKGGSGGERVGEGATLTTLILQQTRTEVPHIFLEARLNCGRAVGRAGGHGRAGEVCVCGCVGVCVGGGAK